MSTRIQTVFRRDVARLRPFRFTAVFLVPALVSAAEADAQGRSEADYQRRLCAGLAQEVELADGSRADCMSTTHAIEVEFSEKWAEALGQALHYAAVTGRQPGIFLICRHAERLCLQHALRLEETIAHWQLPVAVRRVSAQQ